MMNFYDIVFIGRFKDVPEKKEILAMVDFVKLDAMEAQTLTGADRLQEQVEILEGWGRSEIVITSSEGAYAWTKGKSAFVKFTNRATRGRMGRGDALMGSYLARRMDCNRGAKDGLIAYTLQHDQSFI